MDGFGKNLLVIELHENAVEQLGVVLVWDARPGLGRYGYLTPLRHGYIGDILFFDESCLINPGEIIVEGDLVHYVEAADHGRLGARKIRLEQFLADDLDIDFNFRLDQRILKPLTRALEKPSSSFLRAIYAKLSPDERRRLEGEIEAVQEEPCVIAEHLNTMIRSPLIFDKYKFAKVKMRNQTRRLLADKTVPDWPAKLAFLNRLLLEDAIGTEIADMAFKNCSVPRVDAEVEAVRVGFDGGWEGWLRLKFGSVQILPGSIPDESLLPPVGARVSCRLDILRPGQLIGYDVWELPPVGNARTLADVRESRTEDEQLKLVPPLQFDCGDKILVDCNGQRSKEVPLRFADVLTAWFHKDEINRKKPRLQLTYDEIALLYKLGQVKDKAPPQAGEADISFRYELRKKNVKLTGTASGFASDFRRWLKGHGLGAKVLFFNDKSAGRYSVNVSGWHRTRPMINHSEASKKHVNAEDSPED